MDMLHGSRVGGRVGSTSFADHEKALDGVVGAAIGVVGARGVRPGVRWCTS